MKSILIVEDDDELGRSLERGIRAEGYQTTLVDNGVDALIAFAEHPPSAAVVDVMLPQMSGFEMCRRVRQTGSTVPILMLTARDGIDDRVAGLDSGADDYLTKPFSFRELSARLRALLRRDLAADSLVVTIGDARLDSRSMRAWVGEHPLALSPKEFMLLRLLAAAQGAPVTRARILEELWGSTEHIDTNIIDQYIGAIRRKLAVWNSDVVITTVRGVGYRVETAP